MTSRRSEAMSGAAWTGGRQCGAVRFATDDLGRASLCHCRMCQKAFGRIGGPLVTAKGLRWTRRRPKRLQSSNKVRRGFCADCGTPLTYEYEDTVELAIGAFDRPSDIRPAIQLAREARLPWVDGIASLPSRPPEEEKAEALLKSIISYQHPDADTIDRSAPDRILADADP